MTGYGKADFEVKGYTFCVEVKSLNHRHLDLFVRSSDRFFPFDSDIKGVVKSRFSRGSFTVIISTVRSPEGASSLDNGAVERYIRGAEELKKRFYLQGDVDIPFILAQRDIFRDVRPKRNAGEDWRALKAALDKVLLDIERWRGKEGGALKRDISGRLKLLERHLKSARRLSASAIKVQQGKIKERMGELLKEQVPGERQLTDRRILQEAALIAEKGDITEEIVRFKLHIDQFRDYLKSSEAVGRRLDFLCQELLRETNTIGSKSGDVGVTRTVVEIKGELERVREQVQNIE